MSATVDQKGRTITIVGVRGKWSPDAVRPLGGTLLMAKGPLGGPGRGCPAREIVLQFTSSRKAAAAFGALFFDTACGLADAMPDNTEWTCDETRRATRTMK